VPTPSLPRVVVGLSGGVDSAVAALLLREAGWDVHGLFMSNWDEADAYCTIARDFQDARAVSRELGIPLHRVDFSAAYRARVFEYFLAEHRAGRTPNPDVLCNREIKFDACRAHAQRLGADWFATGHYARIDSGPDGIALLKALDSDKDQTYFLHGVRRAQLANVQFPLGRLQKPAVRELARRAGLPVHAKPDSTGICFIGERPFREFLAQFLPEAPGPIETPAGETIGTHRGLAFYTLGQRSGLEVGGRHGHDESAWYVAAKLAARNALVVVQGVGHPALLSRSLLTGPVNLLGGALADGCRCTARLRHRQPEQAVTVRLRAAGTLQLDFDEPQRAVVPGQYAVLYAGERCLGGAVIERTHAG
jgi:tRNA-specific 2-thiouridylase